MPSSTTVVERVDSHDDAAVWVDITNLWLEECAADSVSADDVEESHRSHSVTNTHAKYTTAELLALKPDGVACQPPHDANVALLQALTPNRNDTTRPTSTAASDPMHTMRSDVACTQAISAGSDVITANTSSSSLSSLSAATTSAAATSVPRTLGDLVAQQPCAADTGVGVAACATVDAAASAAQGDSTGSAVSSDEPHQQQSAVSDQQQPVFNKYPNDGSFMERYVHVFAFAPRHACDSPIHSPIHSLVLAQPRHPHPFLGTPLGSRK